MLEIVSGNGLGLSLASLAPMGHPGAPSAPAPGRERVVVNVTTGNLVLQHDDERLAGHGVDLLALRTYNSQGLLDGYTPDNWSGTGWHTQRVLLSGTVNTAGSRLLRTDREGAPSVYDYDLLRGLYVCTDGTGAHDTIEAEGDEYAWIDGDTGLREAYDAVSGRLVNVHDPNGNKLVYHYDAAGRVASIRNDAFETTHFDREGDRLVQIRTVFDDGGTARTLTRVRYEHDAQGRLAAVAFDLSPDDNSVADQQLFHTVYTYDGTSSRIASLTRSDGTSLAFTYVQVGGQHRLATVRDALGQVTRYVHDPANRRTTVIDATNRRTVFQYDAQGRLVRMTGPAVDGVPAVHAFEYDAGGNLVQTTDAEGRRVHTAYDERGNPVEQRDGAGNTVRRTFDAFDMLRTETVYLVPDADGAGPAQPAQGLTRRLVYAPGNKRLLRFEISPEGRVTEHRYNGRGERTATFVYAGAGYDLRPLGERDVPTVHAMMDWAAEQDATRTQRTDTTYDARGRLERIVAYARVDATGQGVADGSESVVRHVHDSAGRLLGTVSATGGRTSHAYDGLGRLLSTVDAAGAVTTHVHDDAHGRVVTTHAGGLVTTQVHDRAGRLVAVQQSDTAATGLGETRYVHDAQGRLRMTVDPTGVRQFRLYDAAGRHVADIDGDGSLTEYVLDRDGRVTQTVAYATAVSTAALVDDEGRAVDVALSALRPAASAADRKTWRVHDDANRLVKVVDAGGAVTETLYDGASRVVATVRRAARVDPGTLGRAPRPGDVAPAASPDDRVARNFHDGDGRLVGTLDAQGYLVELRHDAAGRLVERIAYAMPTPAALRASGTLAQLVPPASAGDQRAVTLYNAKGQVVAQVDAEGYPSEHVYDANGNLAQRMRYANRVSAAVTPASTLAALRPAAHAEDQVLRREHDALDRLVREVDPAGTVTTHDYDAAGRLVRTVRAAGTDEARRFDRRYDLLGRLVGELSAEGAALLDGDPTDEQVEAIWQQHGTRYTYDAAGRRTSATDPLGQRTLYFHDADGRLTHTVNPLGEVEAHRYDALGQLAETVRHASRIATAGLQGGLVDDALRGALDAVRDPARDERTTYTWHAAGALASSTDALGHVTAFDVNAFGEEAARLRQIGPGQVLVTAHAYDRRGLRVRSVEDVGGLQAATATEHDAFGRVVRSTDATGAVRTQAYDGLGRVVQTVDPLNAARTTTYDAFDRVLTQTDALGHVTRYAYDTAARRTRVTTPEGYTVATLRTRHGQVLSVTDARGHTTTHAYDRNGNRVRTTTPLTTEQRRHDAANRLLETTDANGTRTVYTYDAVGRTLTRRVDPDGLNLTTRHAWDALGREVGTIDANGVVTWTAFDRKGQVLRRTVDPGGLNLTTTCAWDARGNVLRVTTPGGTVTRYAYDTLGRRTQEQVDPGGLNLVRRYAYDANGLCTSVTDADGHVTRHVHDAAGRLVYTVDGAGGVLQHAYDAEGRVVRTTGYARPIALAGLPSAASLAQVEARLAGTPGRDAVEQRRHDADGRLRYTVDGAGGVTELRYDAAGHVVERIAYANPVDLAQWHGDTDPPVQPSAVDERVRTVHDALGRATHSIDATGAVVRRTYDGNGNLLTETAHAVAVDPGTAATAAALDAAATAVADAGRDRTVRHGYDAANRLAWSADGAGAVVRFVRDGNGNVVRRVEHATTLAPGADPDGVAARANDRVTLAAYDAAGRQVLSVDALGAVQETAYDGNGQVVRQVAYATPLAAAVLAAAQAAPTEAGIRAGLVADPRHDRVTRSAWDAAGRLVLLLDAEGALTAHSHDGAGRRLSSTAYARVVSDLAAPLPALQQGLASARDRTTHRRYDAAGRLVREVDALGHVTRHMHDGLGRVLATTGHALAVADPDDVPAAHPADRTQAFEYDAAGRLVRSTDALGHAESHAYDAIGRRTAYTNRKGAVWRYEHDAAGRVVAEIAPEVELTALREVGDTLAVATRHAGSFAPVTRLAYDALGNLLARTEALGRPEERTTRYEYDALGRQVRTIFAPVGVYDEDLAGLAANGMDGAASRRESRRTLSTRTFYDVFGDAVASRDVAGSFSYKVYDRAGRVAYEIDALGYVTGHARNAFGETVELVRHANRTTLADAGGGRTRTLAEVRAAVNAPGLDHGQDRRLTTSHDRLGRVVEVVEPHAFNVDPDTQTYFTAGRTTRNVYDAFGGLAQVLRLKGADGATWITTTHYHDKRGRQVASVDALGYVTTRSFDAAGNVEREVEHAVALAPGAWSTEGFAAPVAHADDRVRRYVWDAANRKVAETLERVEHADPVTGQPTRGDLTTTYGYDAVGNLVRTTDAAGHSTYSYHDALGRVRAVAAPARAGADGATLVPLTLFLRDAHGNVQVRIDRARGAAAAGETGFEPGAADAADRTSYQRHDALGRLVQAVDPQGGVRHTSYSARGDVAKTWQTVADAQGRASTLFQAHAYDKLGRLTHTWDPAPTSVLREGGLTMRYAGAQVVEHVGLGRRVVGENLVETGWSSLIDPGAGPVRVQVDYLTASTLYEENGQVLGVASHPARRTVEAPAADATGGVRLAWTDDFVADGGISALTYVRVWQLVDGQWAQRWGGSPAQAGGDGMVTLTQAEAGLTDTALEYNAFGEVVRRGVDGGRQEYFDYDNAGRLWRTSGDDGVDRITLYDRLGRASADIRSAGSGRDDIDLRTLPGIEQAAALTTARRTDFRHDALGRVVARIEPERLHTQGGVTVRRGYASAEVLASSGPASGEGGQFLPDEDGRYTFTGLNEVRVGWASLAALGPGDVKVELHYLTRAFVTHADEGGEPVARMPSEPRVHRSILSAEAAATAATLAWADPDGVAGGIDRVTRLVVSKKDLHGRWVTVVDRSTFGHAGNVVEVAAPDDPTTHVELRVRPAGDGNAPWAVMPLVHFGDALRLDASDWSLGDYVYEVVTTPRGEPERVTADGSLRLQAPPLATIDVPIGFGLAGDGILAWTSPGLAVEQVLHVRPAGSTGAWTRLDVSARGDGRDGVDVRALAAGRHEFELLWIRAGEGEPYAHATGQIEVTAATPPQVVPPVGLPHVEGLRATTALLGGQYDESGGVVGGTVTPILEWPLPAPGAANRLRVRVPGGAWTALAIQTESYFDEGGLALVGRQWASLGGLAPGLHEFELAVLDDRVAIAHATGTLDIAAVQGHWETVIVEVQVPRVVTPPDPANYIIGGTPQEPIYGPPVVVGHDESGNPILGKGYMREVLARDESGVPVLLGAVIAVPYLVYETELREQQVWVAGEPQAPGLVLTTPPYVPGYTIPAMPARYAVEVTTEPGSGAVSVPMAVLELAPQQDGEARWVRPQVRQSFDRWGNLLSVSDPRSPYWNTTYRYNALDQAIEERLADGAATRRAYDRLGRQVAVEDARGHVNRREYDAAGQLVRERHADGGVVEHAYDIFGQRVQTVDAVGTWARDDPDNGLGDDERAQVLAQHTTRFAYDKLGRLTAKVAGRFLVASVGPVTNRLNAPTFAPHVESNTWDAAGRKLTQTNAAGETLTYAYDARGNVVRTQAPGGVTQAAYDARGRKSAELDANGHSSTWRYDHFGLLTGHRDLGGALYTYRYDHARQLVAQSNTRGQDLRYAYDAAGRRVRADAFIEHDATWGVDIRQATTYAYDHAGRRVRERTTQTTRLDDGRWVQAVYQDNHLAYDEVGRLRDVSDARVRIALHYDAVGNRIHIRQRLIDGGAVHDAHRWFQYDAMNRQTVVDAVDDQGTLYVLGADGERLYGDGRRVQYDRNGNRTREEAWGNRVVADGGEVAIIGYDENGQAIYGRTPERFRADQGPSIEAYRYDGLNRLVSVVKDGVQVDRRLYDAASRLVAMGPAHLPQGYAQALAEGRPAGEVSGVEQRLYRYDAAGRLVHQKVLASDGEAKYDLHYDAHDAAGNVLQWRLRSHEGDYTNTYRVENRRFEGYQEARVSGTSTGFEPGATINRHDVNGHLVAVDDTGNRHNHRSFVNDLAGHALHVNHGGQVQRQLVVDGEVLGRYGVAIDEVRPRDEDGNLRFAPVVDFGFGYRPIGPNYPGAGLGAYTVRTGDTLQAIAQAAYGDSKLWFRIAEANGLDGDADLRVGQTLTLPNLVGTVHNDEGSFAPYDPGKVVGDTTPTLPVPRGSDGCGGLGQIIVIVITIVVALVTAYYLGPEAGATVGQTLMNALANPAVAATAFAAGNLAGQVTANVVGLQKGIDWRSVALSAVAGATGAGLSNVTFVASQVGNAMVRAALANAMTQGVAVATGMRDQFDWKGVAASAAGAGVGQQVGAALGLHDAAAMAEMDSAQLLFRRALTGMAAGMTTAVAGGGKVSAQQVAVDAFGNALGESLAQAALRGGQRLGSQTQATNARAGDAPGDDASPLGNELMRLRLFGLTGGRAAELGAGSGPVRLGRPADQPLGEPPLGETWLRETYRSDELIASDRWNAARQAAWPTSFDAGTGVATYGVHEAAQFETRELPPATALQVDNWLGEESFGQYFVGQLGETFRGVQDRLDRFAEDPRTPDGMRFADAMASNPALWFADAVTGTGALLTYATDSQFRTQVNAGIGEFIGNDPLGRTQRALTRYWNETSGLELARDGFNLVAAGMLGAPLANMPGAALSEAAALAGRTGRTVARWTQALDDYAFEWPSLNNAGRRYQAGAFVLPSLRNLRAEVTELLPEHFGVVHVGRRGTAILRHGDDAYFAYYSVPASRYSLIPELRTMDTMGDAFTVRAQAIADGFDPLAHLSEAQSMRLRATPDGWLKDKFMSAYKGSFVHERFKNQLEGIPGAAGWEYRRAGPDIVRIDGNGNGLNYEITQVTPSLNAIYEHARRYPGELLRYVTYK